MTVAGQVPTERPSNFQSSVQTVAQLSGYVHVEGTKLSRKTTKELHQFRIKSNGLYNYRITRIKVIGDFDS